MFTIALRRQARYKREAVGAERGAGTQRITRSVLRPRLAVAPQHAKAAASTRSSWSVSRQCSNEA